MSDEQQRLNDVFNKTYYTEDSVTHTQNPLTIYHLNRLFNLYRYLKFTWMFLNKQERTNTPEYKVLDAGCGNGNMLNELLKLGFSPSNLHGIDMSPDVIEFAKTMVSPEISLSTGSINNTDFDDASFDLIFNNGVLIHVLDDDYIKDIAKEFRRIIKPDGFIFVLVTNERAQWSEKMAKITRNFDFSFNELESLMHPYFTAVVRFHVGFDNYAIKNIGDYTDFDKAIDDGRVKATNDIVVFKPAAETASGNG